MFMRETKGVTTTCQGVEGTWEGHNLTGFVLITFLACVGRGNGNGESSEGKIERMEGRKEEKERVQQSPKKSRKERPSKE
mmetsp:Transcript_14223/g.28534  ORF Transcript_14223/g.28534 Transcript_14223/m.28534 type:complete len:80 (+) Transcript_14223:117-356(+)